MQRELGPKKLSSMEERDTEKPVQKLYQSHRGPWATTSLPRWVSDPPCSFLSPFHLVEKQISNFVLMRSKKNQTCLYKQVIGTTFLSSNHKVTRDTTNWSVPTSAETKCDTNISPRRLITHLFNRWYSHRTNLWGGGHSIQTMISSKTATVIHQTMTQAGSSSSSV